MDEQNSFFADNHNRLLDIAMWARFLAWTILVIYVLLVGMRIINLLQATDEGYLLGQSSQSLSTILKENPFSVIRIAVNMIDTMLQGFIYFIVLKGISLGLNMIIETDVNHREKKSGGGAA